MDRGKAICQEIKKAGIHHIVWLPDSETHFIHAAMLGDPEMKVVQVCREGEAVGVCAGLHLGGKRGAVLIENFGLFETGNVLKWAIGTQMPMLLMVGWLNYGTLKDSPEGKVWPNGQRDFTEPFLKAFGIRYYLVDSDDDVQKIGPACQEAWSTRKPVALVLTSEDGYRAGT